MASTERKAAKMAIQVGAGGIAILATGAPVAIGFAVVIVAVGAAAGLAAFGFYAGKGRGHRLPQET